MEKDQNTSPEIQENVIWKRTKMAMRFWWRHFFTLPISIPFFTSLINSNKHIGFWGFFLIVAIIVDHGKSKNDNPYTSPRSDKYKTLQDIYPGNSLLPGTPAYINRLSDHN